MYWLKEGGMLMYLLALMSVIGTTVIIERFIFFKLNQRKNFNDLRPKFLEFLDKEDLKGAVNYLRNSRSSSGKVVKEIIILWTRTKTENITTLEEKAKEVALREITLLERYMWILSVVANVTPLIGLLGTVTGMIKAFKAVAIHGTGDAAILAEGISEALFTTAGGLMIAIPAVIIYNYYNKKIDNIIMDMEVAGTEVINYFRR